MNKEAIDEMIECQGDFVIQYEREGIIKTHHISNVRYSPEYGNSYILAYSEEAHKEITFKTEKIVDIKNLWMPILSKNAIAPKDGVYLIACGGLGQGIDIEYELLILKEGDKFKLKNGTWAKPMAYHYVPFWGDPKGIWIRNEITIKKGENEKILAPEDGIPIIAYRSPKSENKTIDYCITNPQDHETIWGGTRKDKDVSRCFKERDDEDYFFNEDTGWSECWDGYQILGFTIIREYEMNVCYRHADQRLEIEPNFFLDDDV